MGIARDMTDTIEDIPVSQDAKTLVPLSLSLVAKKERILQMEVTKLEKMLVQRNEMLSKLQENHEYLLMTNGQLQARRCLHREKLVSLKMLLDAYTATDGVKFKSHLSDAIGMNELDATAEKCGVLKDILLGLVDKHVGLEQRCMGIEEQTSRETLALISKNEQLNEARSTLDLLHEDIRSTQWNFEYDQAELAEEDKRLHIASQSGQHEAAMAEKVDTALQSGKSAVEDLQIIWQNDEGMIHEEHRQLAIANESAISEQRKLQMLLESNGATCPDDEEVLQLAKDFQSRLQHVNEEVTSAKFVRRELALRKKQEKEWLAFTLSSIKAKDEQLTWLECQRVHLENEQKEAKMAHASEEITYQAFLKEHKASVTSCENQIKDAEILLKTTERAISARNKNLTAVNKKLAQKTKVLAEWKSKIATNQEQVVKSAATKKLVDAEILAVQNALEQASLNVERTQQLRTTQDMESEKLRSSCAVLESEIQQIHKVLAMLKDDTAAAQTAVKNRIDEIRDKFLSTFVVDDANILIELLNKEIANWATKDADEIVCDAIASETKMLKQRYDDLSAAARKKYGKILSQKEKQYNAKLKMLNAQTAEKREKLAAVSMTCNNKRTGKTAIMKKPARENPSLPLSATGHNPEADDGSEIAPTEDGVGNNEGENQDADPLWNERSSNDTTTTKVPVVTKSSSKLTQEKTKIVQKLALKSARRQLAPGLNLVDESPQTDKELTDIFTTDSTTVIAATKAIYPSNETISKQCRRNDTTGARQPRLKRRTPAQKAGKSVKTASITPEAALPANNVGSVSSTQSDHAVQLSSQGSLYSPIGCDDDLEVSQSAGDVGLTKQTSDTAVPFTTSQADAKKPQLQKQVGQSNKNVVKRRTSTKVTQRSRQSKTKKVNRVSIGRSQASTRTVDWSAADSFSFE
ncbi:unnamed protein product [Peronospora farinosa]|uniref:Uncharacterized protein n=1 Tax=Peronospora farinosa TaxID=134698 RepID=A0ABN8C0B6_9STRA|nr:unnamed protein product [Peronospora farinosa]